MIDTDVLLEPDIVVALLVTSGSRGSVLLISVVYGVSAIVIWISVLLHMRVLVVAGPALIHHARMRGRLRVRTLDNHSLCMHWRLLVGCMALGNWLRLMTHMRCCRCRRGVRQAWTMVGGTC